MLSVVASFSLALASQLYQLHMQIHDEEIDLLDKFQCVQKQIRYDPPEMQSKVPNKPIEEEELTFPESVSQSYTYVLVSATHF